MSKNRAISGAAERQKEIYMNGLFGHKPKLPMPYPMLREKARQKMRPEAFDYLDGGAGADHTVLANRRSFEQWQILPAMMRDVKNVDLKTNYLGRVYKNPFFLCPIGVLELAHRKADLAVAEAAAKCEVPMIISNQASHPIERIAELAMPQDIMFQLYWSKSDELVQSFLSRAQRVGCQAIVVTLDTTMLGWRTRDLQNAFLPFLYAMGMAQYTSDPVFKNLVEAFSANTMQNQGLRPNLSLIRSLIKMSCNFPGRTWQNFRSRKPLTAIRTFIDVFMRPSLEWSDLPNLRTMTDLPIVLKGIQRVDDARKAIDFGVDGIIVSNHGGRQVDGATGSLQALARIGEAVGGEIDILFDSGVRNGADAFKALALGAKAVGIGRPYAFALALGGASGVATLLHHFLAELELTMALSGCPSISAIGQDFLMRQNH